MFLRLLIFISVLALLNGYVSFGIISRWPWAQHHAQVAWSVAVAFWFLQMTALFGNRLLFAKLKQRFHWHAFFLVIDWLSNLAFGIWSCLFIYSLVADILEIAWAAIAPPHNLIDFDRRFLLALGAVTLLTVLVGVRQARTGPRVHNVSIPLRNLPAGFDGFKIAQISDLHAGGTIGRRYIENVVRIVNRLKPDLVALTGDFADGFVKDLAGALAPLSALEAPYGVFFVTGNHEYYWGASAWTEEFARLGARVLRNEHVVLRREGGEIVLAGVTDYSTLGVSVSRASEEVSSPKRALAGAPTDKTKILLAHQPISYRMAHEAGFDLQISGHTHGGQYFPFSLLIRFFQRYYKGLNRYETLWVYVSRGAGYWGPPLRTGVPSEIACISLRMAERHAASEP